jgi:hypothetical protein
MGSVARLVTFVDIAGVPDDRVVSVSARHEAVLADGRRMLLLGDRGWTSSSSRPGDVPDAWAHTSAEEFEATARTVVGPDEPFGGRSPKEMEAGHWAYLAGVLQERGVVVEPAELERLPHEVVLSERLLARIG